jgi:hypothetical protein
MTKDEFHTRLRQFLHRRPFRPFVVELTDGRRLVIKKPNFAFSDGGAGFIDPEDGALVDFLNDDVRSIEPLKKETSVDFAVNRSVPSKKTRHAPQERPPKTRRKKCG